MGNGKMEHEMKREIGVASAVMWLLYQTVTVKSMLSTRMPPGRLSLEVFQILRLTQSKLEITYLIWLGNASGSPRRNSKMLLGCLCNSGKAGYTWLFVVSSVEWQLKWTLKSHAIKHKILAVLALHCNVGLSSVFSET